MKAAKSLKSDFSDLNQDHQISKSRPEVVLATFTTRIEMFRFKKKHTRRH